jgi:hypothetical protein
VLHDDVVLAEFPNPLVFECADSGDEIGCEVFLSRIVKAGGKDFVFRFIGGEAFVETRGRLAVTIGSDRIGSGGLKGCSLFVVLKFMIVILWLTD